MPTYFDMKNALLHCQCASSSKLKACTGYSPLHCKGTAHRDNPAELSRVKARINKMTPRQFEVFLEQLKTVDFSRKEGAPSLENK